MATIWYLDVFIIYCDLITNPERITNESLTFKHGDPGQELAAYHFILSIRNLLFSGVIKVCIPGSVKVM